MCEEGEVQIDGRIWGFGICGLHALPWGGYIKFKALCVMLSTVKQHTDIRSFNGLYYTTIETNPCLCSRCTHFPPANRLSCTSVKALLPLTNATVPTTAATGRVWNKFQLT